MPFPSSVVRPSAILLLSAALLAGCADAAAEKRAAVERALAAALADYGTVATSHLAPADKKDLAPVAYAAPTVNGVSVANPKPTWPDLRLEASRLDQYAALAKRFQAIADDAGATPAQKGVALAAASEIQASRARFLVGRADLDRVTLARHGANLESELGKLEAQFLAKAAPRGGGIVTLIEGGEASGTKVASLGELTKAAEAASDEYKKADEAFKAAQSGKGDLRAKADELFAKETELKISARRVVGKDRFDLLDQASISRCEAEKIEASILGNDVELGVLQRNLKLCADKKVALDQAIASYQEQLDAAKKDQGAANTGSQETAKQAAALHDQWVAEAKIYDGLFAERVDAPLAQAALATKEAQGLLAKAAQTAGSGDALPTQSLDQASLAAGLAQAEALRLRVLDAHKANLAGLAAREKVWLSDQTGSFIPARLEELGKTEGTVVVSASAACAEADTAVAAALQGKLGDDAKAALESVQKNVAAHLKTVKAIAKGLGVEAAPEAPKAEAPKAEEPKAEAKPEAAPEAKPDAAPAPAAEEKPAN